MSLNIVSYESSIKGQKTQLLEINHPTYIKSDEGWEKYLVFFAEAVTELCGSVAGIGGIEKVGTE